MNTLNTDKLAKALALAASDQDGEALNALRSARSMLAAAGMTFVDVAEAVRTKLQGASAPTAPAAVARGPSFTDFFAGFDDHMEAKQPGWKAQQAAARADRIRREAEEREAIIRRYGSERSGKLPNERERRLNRATKHLRRRIRKDYSNGTFTLDSLDGWTDSFHEEVPTSVREAITAAFPMPTSLREARDEYGFWQARDRELERLYCLPGETGGDTYLSLPALARRKVIDDMLRNGPILTLDDLLVRLEDAAEDHHCAADAAPATLEAFQRLVIGEPLVAPGGTVVA